MERLEKGATYDFISIPHWKVCVTHDCYFPTDDDRFEKGNYFPDAKAAHECFSEICETYGDRIAQLKKDDKANTAAFLKTCCSLAQDGKGAKKAKDHKKVSQGLVSAYTQYKDTAAKIAAELDGIYEEIQDLITKAPKTL